MRTAFVIVLATSCSTPTPPPASGSGSGSPAGSGSNAKLPPPDAAASSRPAAFASWMPKDVEAAWQGAWLGKMEMRDEGKWSAFTGMWAAVAVDGAKLHAWVAGPDKDHDVSFAVASPCQIKMRSPGGNGYGKVFLIDNGALRVDRGGAAGYRKGKSALVCSHTDDVYVLDDKGTCTKFHDHFGEWESEPSTCTWSTGKPSWAMGGGWADEKLVVGEPDMANELAVKGDLLVNIHFREAFEGKTWEKQPDLATAKTAATKRFKETDPLERVKTAGGKVGELGTILDVHATFLDDKANVKGKTLDVVGVVAGVRADDVKGQKVWRVTLLDARDTAKDWEFSCTSPKEIKLAAGTKVHAKGVGSESWDRAALAECAVTK